MFQSIKNSLQALYSQFTTKLHTLLSRTTLDGNTIKELETLLLHADTGVKTTNFISNELKKRYVREQHTNSTLKDELSVVLNELLKKQVFDHQASNIVLLVGINGSGKTTLASKLAYAEKQKNKRVLLVAADTFRAAATEQLALWASRLEVDIVTGTQGQDPASVVFAGCEKYLNENYDTLIIDTAGRLQTKVNLMKELEKIKRVISKQLPDKPICTLLTIDALLGQNSFEQAQLFHQSTHIDGIALTKMDGTSKGGIIFSIVHELTIPLAYISFGENFDQCQPFDSAEYIKSLLDT